MATVFVVICCCYFWLCKKMKASEHQDVLFRSFWGGTTLCSFHVGLNTTQNANDIFIRLTSSEFFENITNQMLIFHLTHLLFHFICNGACGGGTDFLLIDGISWHQVLLWYPMWRWMCTSYLLGTACWSCACSRKRCEYDVFTLWHWAISSCQIYYTCSSCSLPWSNSCNLPHHHSYPERASC